MNRGLIEARGMGGRPLEFDPLPRFMNRGLIEACRLSCRFGLGLISLPRFMNRGLIEAPLPLIPSELHSRHFPDS